MSQTRRDFLKTAGAVTAGALISQSPLARRAVAADSPRKPNVIFVFADQLRSMALGCYGDKQAITPNIDKLAAGGVLFTNSVSTWPVCSPFRAMLLTGRYPMSNGVVYNNYPILDGQNTIATTLKAQRYETGYIGKWHLNGNEPNVPNRCPCQ